MKTEYKMEHTAFVDGHQVDNTEKRGETVSDKYTQQFFAAIFFPVDGLMQFFPIFPHFSPVFPEGEFPSFQLIMSAETVDCRQLTNEQSTLPIIRHSVNTENIPKKLPSIPIRLKSFQAWGFLCK